MKSCQWWEEPSSLDEVESYLDRKFERAGDQPWVNLLRSSIKESIERVIGGEEPYEDVKGS